MWKKEHETEVVHRSQPKSLDSLIPALEHFFSQVWSGDCLCMVGEFVKARSWPCSRLDETGEIWGQIIGICIFNKLFRPFLCCLRLKVTVPGECCSQYNTCGTLMTPPKQYCGKLPKFSHMSKSGLLCDCLPPVECELFYLYLVSTEITWYMFEFLHHFCFVHMIFDLCPIVHSFFSVEQGFSVIALFML